MCQRLSRVVPRYSPVKYFDREDVYLTQSSQFYLEVLIYTLEKVYTVAPSFRLSLQGLGDI